ncbi:AMP-binding protein [Alcaligenes sp. WGS1538]|uniref:AMP-binding protein n=1 Tax=Alcaligenes sp. WGS1538 TaxID=3366811 RepID=UPI00372D5025
MANTTVYQAFRDTAQRWGDKPFVCTLPETAEIYGIPAGELSYGQALERIDALRADYAAAGYGHGHRVGILLENRPVFFLHWFALNSLGVSIVPINPDLRAAELEYLIGHSEMIMAIALPSRHQDLVEAAQRAGQPFAIMADGDVPPVVTQAASRSCDMPDEHSECALLYTSGTTGRPKGCMLSNQYFHYAGEWYRDIGGLARLHPGQERMLTPLPLFHMNAMACSTMAMVKTGGCLISLDRFHPRSWWQSVRESRATVVHYLGVMPAILMKAEPSAQDREHQVRFGFGAGVDRGLHPLFEERFGFPLLEAWAMTETGAGASIIANHEPRHIGTSCFGKEMPVVEVLLMTDEGRPAATDENGELLVRSAGENPRYGFFSGYWKDPAATDEAWKDGWFHTGDIVRRDAQGYLHFVDRKKNVIRRSGENIAAVEVENILQQNPLVRSIAVAAVPDDIRGDEVMALVVPHAPLASREDKEKAAVELVKWGLTQLAYFKVPGYVLFVDALPLTSTNKIQRGELKTVALAALANPDCINTNHLKKRQEA